MNRINFHFIGGGRITRIFLQVIYYNNLSPGKIIVTDHNSEVLDKLKATFSTIQVSTDNSFEIGSADIVFVALHPPVLIENLLKIKGLLRKETIIVSLAPKISISKIAETLGGLENIVRMIPNAPSVTGNGYNPIAYSGSISREAVRTVENICKPLGKMPVVDEKKLEAYAIVSAMGPTYFWFQFYKLKELAVEFGFAEVEADEAIREMISGTVKSMYGNLSKQEVLDLVPVKPIGDHEHEILRIYDEKLTGLFVKLTS